MDVKLEGSLEFGELLDIADVLSKKDGLVDIEIEFEEFEHRCVICGNHATIQSPLFGEGDWFCDNCWN